MRAKAAGEGDTTILDDRLALPDTDSRSLGDEIEVCCGGSRAADMRKQANHRMDCFQRVLGRCW